ncbi:MAG: putative toxin-antitoxin system toxin component, PIN family [Saprospiraceae bacterium]|nr:putative toxin-antitoxin system toxin component, PIN family [Saprospiraceae bacterium]MCF8251147.1 putative toxin-antitoxin system toxin component, PIN family [Saprospiraceae bacterium]MCF8281870.1 putative toxin-antitoxin system toxin component, PIN family [Bacteroidales bacterium]MCF8312959.1 putative toxin-antitoxin system toxin component, PIN family [Saprospiraceae bacterium]MCF8441406.1 putative toxin-antitoxin system toxin component, PIN family [Saprospiraceae bacterium]
MTIVLDTNCLLQIIPRFARHRWLFDMVKNSELEVAVTTEILAEYEEQLSDFYAPAVAAGVLQQLDILENVLHIQVYYKWNLIAADPDDNKFTDCAVAAAADYLVTYDRHFRVLSSIGFPPIACLTIEELKEVLLAI